MTSPPSISFSKPAMAGDAVSVLVLVEDSATMAAKWSDVRDSYLPNLLENLRSADPSVQMEARWLTTSSASSVSPHFVADVDQARSVPELPIAQSSSAAKFSPSNINRAIEILSTQTRRQSTTRHLVLIAATGPLTQGPNDATPSGFDLWDDIAVILKQHYVRLHVILNIGAEMRTYHELFKRSLQLQNNSEVPPWFPVDSRRYSIRLSGRPQYVRSSAAVPVQLVQTAISEDSYNNPSPPNSSPGPASPPATISAPSSPVQTMSSNGRKSSHSPTTPRSRPRATDSPQSPPASEGGGLVSYLQQIHGLTKKKSYGIKAPKKTYADIRLPNAGRPILPRLEVPQSQTDIYTYPSFDHTPGSEAQISASDAHPPPPRRHSVDQFPTSSLVARTSNEDRRARRRGPWLPIAPLVSSTPSSPTSATSPGTLAALQSLASMTPRLPDFATKDRLPHNTAQAATDPRAAYAMVQSNMSLSSAGYYPDSTASWVQQNGTGSPSIPSPTHAISSSASFSDATRHFLTPPSPPSLVGSDYAYSSSPPGSSVPTPQSISAPTNDSAEDQPFVVTAEYEAIVNARFDEAVRSGEMQASMTPAIHSAVPALSGSSYIQNIQEEQMYYAEMTAAHVHSADAGYPLYPPNADMSAGMQANAAWQYEVANSYVPAPVPDYGWYAS